MEDYTLEGRGGYKPVSPTVIEIAENGKMIVNGNCTIMSGSKIIIRDGGQLTLNNCSVNNDSRIMCGNRISIVNNVKIAAEVLIRDCDDHTIFYENGKQSIKSKEIFIDDNVWICQRATILKGVHIGEGSIVGAGAVVTHDVLPHCIVAGNPAKVIKTNVLWE